MIVFVYKNRLYLDPPWWLYIAFFLVVFCFPAIWPIGLIRLRRRIGIPEHPTKRSWDYVFGSSNPYWVIMHLKNGTRIGAKYSAKSFASSYPAEEQIYVEQAWRHDDNGKFVKLCRITFWPLGTNNAID